MDGGYQASGWVLSPCPVGRSDWLGDLFLRLLVVPVFSHDAIVTVIQNFGVIARDVPDCQPAPTSGLAPRDVPMTDHQETRWASVVAGGDAKTPFTSSADIPS